MPNNFPSFLELFYLIKSDKTFIFVRILSSNFLNTLSSSTFFKNYKIMISSIITISPEIQSGTPVFAKTRVPVKILFDYIKNGDSIETFLEDFPSVKKEQVLQLLKLLENQVTFSNYEENFA